jgi:hypothetical protein
LDFIFKEALDMFNRLAIVGLCVSGGLLAAEAPPKKIQISKTEHLDFPPGGVLTMTNSIGTLTVEGWDQPQVEITTVKTSRLAIPDKKREKASAELDKVLVKAERKGDEVVIATDFPRHRDFPPGNPWGHGVNFDLEYQIRVPRDARLVVSGHDVGEIHVDDLTSDIDVRLLQGANTLHLPEDGKYAINANVDFGTVNCDFPGVEKRTLSQMGHRWVSEESSGAHKLKLKVGYGDVVILKTHIPQAPPSLLASPQSQGL